MCMRVYALYQGSQQVLILLILVGVAVNGIRCVCVLPRHVAE